mmetsp:Transcript_16623/g.34918  ORF Transcript_16623/g.34918 Transcript_16623/m.34918 type:complete len:95 (+) Transcript_16623:95-379(+)
MTIIFFSFDEGTRYYLRRKPYPMLTKKVHWVCVSLFRWFYVVWKYFVEPNKLIKQRDGEISKNLNPTSLQSYFVGNIQSQMNTQKFILESRKSF